MRHIQLDDAQRRMDANAAAEMPPRITDAEVRCHWSWQKSLKYGRCWKFSAKMKLLWHDRSHELNSALINCNEAEFPSCSGGDLLFGHVRGYKTSPNRTEHVCGVCVRVCVERGRVISIRITVQTKCGPDASQFQLSNGSWQHTRASQNVEIDETLQAATLNLFTSGSLEGEGSPVTAIRELSRRPDGQKGGWKTSGKDGNLDQPDGSVPVSC